MAQQITLSPAWCDEHLAQCWHINENGITRSLCNPESIQPAGTATMAAKMAELKEKGYTARHTYPGYTLTRYASQPLALPIDWQIANEERPEYVDVDQDW